MANETLKGLKVAILIEDLRNTRQKIVAQHSGVRPVARALWR